VAPKKKQRHFRPKPIPVKLDEALLARIDALAEKLHEPRSTVMRFAMRIGIENLLKAIEAGADLSHLAQQTHPTQYPPHQEQSWLVEDHTEVKPRKRPSS
jgi:predicted transcriptional regulator